MAGNYRFETKKSDSLFTHIIMIFILCTVACLPMKQNTSQPAIPVHPG